MENSDNEQSVLDIQKFLETHPKYKTESVPDELIERYVNVFPDILLKFWKEHGFGTYGNGFIQFINPDEYKETLNMWMLREDDGTRIPFAISAFGEVFYWRHIYNPNPDEDFPQWVFDVSYFNPHNSETGLCAYTLGEFFGEYIVDEEIINVFKWQYHSGYSIGLMEDALSENQNPDTTLFEKAVKKLGVLKKDEMYFFVPALRLGGTDDIEYVDKGHALVHLDLLFQLSGEVPYDSRNDLYDFYEEVEKLTTPADFDRRIDELKSELDGTDDAAKNYLIAKLFDEYPYYDESIKNQDDVNRRVKEQALLHHSKAKELEPDTAKYYYASFSSQLSDYNRKNWSNAESDIEKFYELGGEEDLYLRAKYNLAHYKNDDDGVLNFSEKIYDFTGIISELSGAAKYFQSKGNYETAMEIYRRIFNDSTEFYDARTAARGIADIYREKKQKAESFKIFEELKYRFPEEEAEILNEIALFVKVDYNDKSRLENAVEYFKKAIKKGEDNALEDHALATIYCNLFHTYEEMNDFDNAKSVIEKAYETYNDTYYQDEKARLLYKMGDEDEAKETFSNSEFSDKTFQKKFDDANWQDIVWSLDSSPVAFDKKIEKLKAELEENSQDAQKQFLLAKLYENYPVYMMNADEQENQYQYVVKSAFGAYCDANDLEEDNPIYQLHFAEFLYSNHYNIDAEEESKFEMMRNGYQFYIDHSENPYDGYEGLKKMAQYRDNWDEIIKYAKLAYEVKPEMTHELLDLGSAYKESGRYNEAAQVYQEYLQAEPDFYNQLNGKQGLAETYIKAGDPNRAEKLLEEVARNADSNKDKYDIYQKAADAFRWNNDFENAIKFQEKAVYFAELTGDEQYTFPTAILELSSLYEQKGDLNEAIALAQKNCNMRGDNYDYSRLGSLYKENNQPNEARTVLKKALNLYPDDQYTKDLLEELGDDKKGSGFFGKWF